MGTNVQGHCPMGCGKTLFLAADGYVTCSWAHCPNPSAVADLLAVNEPHHIVELTERDFRLQHPMRERLEGELFDCALHQFLNGLDGPPRKPGRYEAVGDGPWTFLALPKAEAL